jgi:adenylosuccinate lyase
MVPDLLAQAASEGMRTIWSPLANVWLERDWWITIMRGQRRIGGVGIPPWAIDSSADVANPGSEVLDRIRERELITKHDVKARLEIFCEDAGHEYHHLGLTSADVVENCMQIRIRRSLELLVRQHGWSNTAVNSLLGRYVLRGLKGPVGTQQDLLDLVGSAEKCTELEQWLAQLWGFTDVASSTPQTMHRSQDLDVLSCLASTVIGFHRRSALSAVLRGYMFMAAEYSGDTWNEGDVSSSVVRRVCIPGAFYAADCITRDVTP